MHSSPVYVHVAGTNVAGSGKTAELKRKSFIPEEKKSPAVPAGFVKQYFLKYDDLIFSEDSVTSGTLFLFVSVLPEG